MNARDELALTIHTHHCIESVHNEDCMFWADDHESAEAVRTAGYSKPRTITTPAEANALPDRSAFLTPGGIIFRRWEGYYAEGKDAWERELGKVVPAELLSAEGHFPATVLHEGGAA